MLEHFDEFAADNFPFCFRIGHAFEHGEEAFARVRIFQTHVKIFAENALDDFFLARTEQSIIHENAGKLVANGFMQERSGHGRIDPAA